MIAFACKKCGKQLSRPDQQAGTMIFCDCGQGNRVPWSSGPVDAIPTERVPVAPPSLPTRPQPILDAMPVSPTSSEVPMPSRRPGRLIGKINPNFCFHHDEDPSTTNCTDCRLPFCASCVVVVRGQTLCGPCKNFRLAGSGQPRRPLPLAVVALVVSLASGPVALILSLAGAGLFFGEGLIGVAVTLCLLAGALPTCSLFLASMALKRIDAQPQTSGHSLATSAACCGLISVVWCVTVALLLVGKHVLD
jgi:hypothetical protein